MRVSLPQWILEQDLHHQNHHFNHHKKKVGGHNSMAKQFGSLGKKFRKNLAKMTSNSKTSNSSRDHLDHSRTKVVSANQSFILGLYSTLGQNHIQCTWIDVWNHVIFFYFCPFWPVLIIFWGFPKTYGPLRTTTKPTDLTLKPTDLTKIVLYTTTDHYGPDPKTYGPHQTLTHYFWPLRTWP